MAIHVIAFVTELSAIPPSVGAASISIAARIRCAALSFRFVFAVTDNPKIYYLC